MLDCLGGAEEGLEGGGDVAAGAVERGGGGRRVEAHVHLPRRTVKRRYLTSLSILFYCRYLKISCCGRRRRVEAHVHLPRQSVALQHVVLALA